MKERVVCIDWFAKSGETTELRSQKDWYALLPEIVVLNISDVSIKHYEFGNVLLLVVHTAAMGRSNYDYLENSFSTASPAPYVMFVSTQPNEARGQFSKSGRWNESRVPFPSKLGYLSPAFSKLVAQLIGIPRSSNDPDLVQRRIQAWEEWERHIVQPAVNALYVLCQGYLAAHGWDGLNGWTADLQRRVPGDNRNVITRFWWFEDLFESASDFQQAICSELNAQGVERLPDGILQLVSWIGDNKEKPIGMAIVQRAYEALGSIQGQK